jgi:hypothetical protein
MAYHLPTAVTQIERDHGLIDQCRRHYPHLGHPDLCKLLDNNLNPTDILTRISMKYFSLKTRGGDVLTGIHLDLHPDIERLTQQNRTVEATQCQRPAFERNTN